MDSDNKGGKVPPNLQTWGIIWAGVTIVWLAIGIVLPEAINPAYLALPLGVVGNGMLCVAAIVDCIQKGKRHGQEAVHFKRLVATGSVLVFWGAWALSFTRLEEILNIRFPF